MTQFAIDTEAEAEAKISEAPASVQARIKTLEDEGREIKATNFARMDEANDMTAQIQETTLRLHVTRKEEEKAGKYRTESTEIDPKTGGEVTIRKLTNQVQKVERELAALHAKRKELQNKKPKPAWIDQVREDLGMNEPRPMIVADPIEWKPKKGETIKDGYAREFHLVATLLAEEKKIWDAHRPLAEAEKTLLAAIDRAAVAPGFGGFVRGSSWGHRGQQVETNPSIAWPRERPGLDSMETHNAPGLLIWLFRDEMKAAAIRELRSKFTDEGTIPASQKPAMLSAIATKIWHQRRIVEAAYQYARANGIKNLNRPRGTPTEILIDCLPWKNSAAIQVERAPMPDKSPDEPNFEDDVTDELDGADA